MSSLNKDFIFILIDECIGPLGNQTPQEKLRRSLSSIRGQKTLC